MSFVFAKMHGAGNDFIVVDDSVELRHYTKKQIRSLCDRRNGIGADGLISLRKQSGETAIRMLFFNCDGSRADLCGNGLRCAAAFAYRMKLSKEQLLIFQTDSGLLSAEILDEQSVRITLPVTEEFRFYEDVDGFQMAKGAVGVPHAVVPVNDINQFDVRTFGAKLRNHNIFAPSGVNVDFVELSQDASAPVKIRTYERGVEDETLACGTGIASAALVLWKFYSYPQKVDFLSRSNALLTVEIIATGNIVKEILLTGPACLVYTGNVSDSAGV